MGLDFDKDLTVTHHLRILTATATMTALSYFNKDMLSALLADDARSPCGSILYFVFCNKTIFSVVGSCYESFSDVGEIRVWWRADFQSVKKGVLNLFLSISMAYNVTSCQKVAENTQVLKIAKFAM